MLIRIVAFLILFAFWIALSGMFDAFHLTLGVISSLLVVLINNRLLFSRSVKGPVMRRVVGMLGYLPWLFCQIVVACLDVARIVLSPRMHDLIDPQIVHFTTRLKSTFARVAFAQSITLTPGTVTVFIQADEFAVYALTQAAADSLPGEMEERIYNALES